MRIEIKSLENEVKRFKTQFNTLKNELSLKQKRFDDEEERFSRTNKAEKEVNSKLKKCLTIKEDELKNLTDSLRQLKDEREKNSKRYNDLDQKYRMQKLVAEELSLETKSLTNERITQRLEFQSALSEMNSENEHLCERISDERNRYLQVASDLVSSREQTKLLKKTLFERDELILILQSDKSVLSSEKKDLHKELRTSQILHENLQALYKTEALSNSFQFTKLQNDIKHLLEALEKLKKENEETKLKNKNYESLLNSTSSILEEIKEEHENEIVLLTTKLNEALSDKSQNDQVISDLTIKNNTLDEEIFELAHANRELTYQLSDMNTKLTNKINALNKASAKLTDQFEQIKILNNDIGQTRQKNTDQMQENMALKKVNKSLEEKLLLNEVKLKRFDELNCEITLLKQKLQTDEIELKNSKQAFDSLEKALKKSESECLETSLQLNQLKEAMSNKIIEFDSMRSELLVMVEKNSKLNDLNKIEKESSEECCGVLQSINEKCREYHNKGKV